jgi:hypothetical protein
VRHSKFGLPTADVGQRLKGSQRAYRVRSTPITGRNVATQRFSALGQKAAVCMRSKYPVAVALAARSIPALGPDFHRLDRTSFRLAHLLNHLVGDGEKSLRHLNAERSRRLQIDHELKLGRPQHRQIGGLLTFEDAPDVDAGLALLVGTV